MPSTTPDLRIAAVVRGGLAGRCSGAGARAMVSRG